VRRPVLHGAGIALAIGVPASLLGQALTAADIVDDESPWLAPFVLAVIFGFGLGGWVARRPLAGALAAVLAFAALQVIAVVRTVVAGDDVEWALVVFNAGVAGVTGALGGGLAAR
jgi:energy-converting hydrogenase Eha subunit H